MMNTFLTLAVVMLIISMSEWVSAKTAEVKARTDETKARAETYHAEEIS